MSDFGNPFHDSLVTELQAQFAAERERSARLETERDASVAREAVLRDLLTQIIAPTGLTDDLDTAARAVLALSQPSAATEAFRARVRREALAEVRIEMLGDHSTYTTWSYVQISDELHRIRALADKESGT